MRRQMSPLLVDKQCFRFQNEYNKVKIALHVVQFWCEIKLVLTNCTPASRSCNFVITRLISRQISLSHAMRPGLIRHFWVANRAGPENDNKFKERVLKINIESFGNFFGCQKHVSTI